MVALSAPLVVAVVLPALGHVPQVLTSPEVLMFITDPPVELRAGNKAASVRVGYRLRQPTNTMFVLSRKCRKEC